MQAHSARRGLRGALSRVLFAARAARALSQAVAGRTPAVHRQQTVDKSTPTILNILAAKEESCASRHYLNNTILDLLLAQ
jgi:hypothetical protein